MCQGSYCEVVKLEVGKRSSKYYDTVPKHVDSLSEVKTTAALYWSKDPTFGISSTVL
jgi:hypothetical protein